MSVRFNCWNWEFDFGKGELPDNAPLPEQFVEAHFDERGRLFRVDRHESGVESHIEYFCDEAGRVLEKRSYDEFGGLDVLVRIAYDREVGFAVEEAWTPDQPRAVTARVLLARYPLPEIRRRT